MCCTLFHSPNQICSLNIHPYSMMRINLHENCHPKTQGQPIPFFCLFWVISRGVRSNPDAASKFKQGLERHGASTNNNEDMIWLKIIMFTPPHRLAKPEPAPATQGALIAPFQRLFYLLWWCVFRQGHNHTALCALHWPLHTFFCSSELSLKALALRLSPLQVDHPKIHGLLSALPLVWWGTLLLWTPHSSTGQLLELCQWVAAWRSYPSSTTGKPRSLETCFPRKLETRIRKLKDLQLQTSCKMQNMKNKCRKGDRTKEGCQNMLRKRSL